MAPVALSPAEILNTSRSDAPPVDVNKLARDLGLTVYPATDLGQEIAGKIVKDPSGGESGYAIYINRNDNRRRQRFTLAHEIAHYILHRDLIGDGLTDDAMYRSKLGDVRERQANRMAADILMPAPLVARWFKERTDNVTQLAAAFDVSAEAMAIRVKELSLSREMPLFQQQTGI